LDPFRLFFAHSFAKESTSLADGEIPDCDLAVLVETWIREFSHNQIEVVKTRDPYHNYISSSVRQDICSSDAVLCLFTKRVKDGLTNCWLPSTYVISEGAAALMQFKSETETHRRLFGIVEEGVDPNQLGMAFHSDKPALRFRRSDLNQLESCVRQIVSSIRGERGRVEPRRDYEYLSIDKLASIFRNGWVRVRTRHRYRMTAEKNPIRIAHKIWRVSHELPTIRELLNDEPSVGYLRVMPTYCGTHDPERYRGVIRPSESDHWGYERSFFVEIPDLRLKPGDILEYEVAWGYPNAFHSLHSLPRGNPNCVGLRTSTRGPVGHASLTLEFERDWQIEPFHTLEGPPQLFINHSPELPGSCLPEEFIHNHNKSEWVALGELKKSPQLSGTHAEVYQWGGGPFSGMIKAIFEPHQNYFYDSTDHEQVGSVDGDESESKAHLEKR